MTTDDPNEEEKQRAFKALLNKLTPEKYDAIKKKVLEVEIISPHTLAGLVIQVKPFQAVSVTVLGLICCSCESKRLLHVS